MIPWDVKPRGPEEGSSLPQGPEASIVRFINPTLEYPQCNHFCLCGDGGGRLQCSPKLIYPCF